MFKNIQIQHFNIRVKTQPYITPEATEYHLKQSESQRVQLDFIYFIYQTLIAFNFFLFILLSRLNNSVQVLHRKESFLDAIICKIGNVQTRSTAMPRSVLSLIERTDVHVGQRIEFSPESSLNIVKTLEFEKVYFVRNHIQVYCKINYVYVD